jgi:hypothetical protein
MLTFAVKIFSSAMSVVFPFSLVAPSALSIWLKNRYKKTGFKAGFVILSQSI